MNKPLSNMAESVRTRLLNLRAKTGDDYNELLVRFCLERLDTKASRQGKTFRLPVKLSMASQRWI
jgi:hypothetical protein